MAYTRYCGQRILKWYDGSVIDLEDYSSTDPDLCVTGELFYPTTKMQCPIGTNILTTTPTSPQSASGNACTRTERTYSDSTSRSTRTIASHTPGYYVVRWRSSCTQSDLTTPSDIYTFDDSASTSTLYRYANYSKCYYFKIIVNSATISDITVTSNTSGFSIEHVLDVSKSGGIVHKYYNILRTGSSSTESISVSVKLTAASSYGFSGCLVYSHTRQNDSNRTLYSQSTTGWSSNTKTKTLTLNTLKSTTYDFEPDLYVPRYDATVYLKDWKSMKITSGDQTIDITSTSAYRTVQVDSGTILYVRWYDNVDPSSASSYESTIAVDNPNYPGTGSNYGVTVDRNMSLYPANPPTYQIVVTKTGSGTVSGSTTVNHGASTTLSFTPSSNYAIGDVSVDGTSVGAVSSYTFSNVTSNHSLNVSFVRIYKVTVYKDDYAEFYWFDGSDSTHYSSAYHEYLVPFGTTFDIDWNLPSTEEDYSGGYVIRRKEYSSANKNHMATTYGGTDLGDSVTITGTSTYHCAALVTSVTTYYLNILYDANGGQDAPSGVTTISGTTTSLQYTVSTTKPTRSGYDFLGWYRNSSTASTPNMFPGTTYNWQYGTNTLYAVWGYVKFTSNGHCTVTVLPKDSNDSSRMIGVPYQSTVSVNNSTGAITITGPSGTGFSGTCTIAPDEGYEFTSWSRSVGNLTAAITQAVTFTATISVKLFVVLFTVDPSGSGTLNGGQVTYQVSDVPYNTAVTINGNKMTVNGTIVTATPATNYNFDAWRDTNGNIIPNGAQIKGNVTVVASFSRATYTVTIGTTAHTSASPLSVSELLGTTQVSVANDGRSLTIGSTVVSVSFDSGWILDYWRYTDPATSQSRQLSAGQSVSITGATTFTVYAKEQTYTHTIHYEANSGTGTMSDTVVTDTNSGSTNVTLSECGFQYEGMVFLYWNVMDAGFDDKGNFNPGETVAVPGDTTYYAVANWTESGSYFVFFDPNGEGATTPEQSRRVTNGQRFDHNGPLPTPVWEGHTFSGWYSEDLGWVYDSTIVDMYKNEFLYAQWDSSTGIPLGILTTSGGNVSDGTTTGSTLSLTVQVGDVFRISNTGVITVGGQTITPIPDLEYVFSHWTPENMDGRRVRDTDTEFLLTAHFTDGGEEKPLYVSSDDADKGLIYNGVSSTASFTGAVQIGDVFHVSEGTINVGSYTLTAVPASGYVFQRWEGITDGRTVIYSDEYFRIFAHFIEDTDSPDTRVPETFPTGGLNLLESGTSPPCRCYLAFYPTKGNVEDPTAVLELPNIQAIEETDSAQITEISTIIYGFDNNFAMDIGTVQKFTITLTRVQPKTNVLNDDNFNNQRRWNNGHWFSMFKYFIQRWQNLNHGIVQNVNIWTGGFRFHFEPGVEEARNNLSYADLYPVIDKYVFVLGSIDMRVSGENLQNITVTIPLTVGSMVRQKDALQDRREITYLSGSNTGNLSKTMTYPDYNVFPVASVPSEWLLNEALGFLSLNHWASNNIGTDEDGRQTSIWYPGMLAKDTPLLRITQMTADWTEPIAVYAYSADSEIDLSVNQSLRNKEMRVWVISGGGGGGTGGSILGNIDGNGGGGGGSGGFYSFRYKLTNETSKIRFEVGEGGEKGSGGDDGEDGGDSAVILVKSSEIENEICRVPGGKGGKQWRAGGKGGVGSLINGSSGEDGLDDDDGGHGGNGGEIYSLVDGINLGVYNGRDYWIRCSPGVGGGYPGGDGGDAPSGSRNGIYYCGGGGGGGAAGYNLGGNSGGNGAGGYIIVAFYP